MLSDKINLVECDRDKRGWGRNRVHHTLLWMSVHRTLHVLGQETHLLLWTTVRIVARAQPALPGLFPTPALAELPVVTRHLSQLPALPAPQKEPPTHPIFLSPTALLCFSHSSCAICNYRIYPLTCLFFATSHSSLHTLTLNHNLCDSRDDIMTLYGKCFRHSFSPSIFQPSRGSWLSCLHMNLI